jgi:hypothetical protein
MKAINKSQLRNVTILVRYTVKATGTIILLVENDKGVRYYCTLNENGSNSCSCPATKECYHLKAVIVVENARKGKWEAYKAALAKQLAKQFVTTQIVEQIAEQLVAPAKVVKASKVETASLNAAPANWTNILPSRNKSKVA